MDVQLARVQPAPDGARRPNRDGPPRDAAPIGPLPYGRRMGAALPALHRAFLVLNRRAAAPALRAGLGPLFSTPIAGSLMLLRTRGRTSGLIREAPLGYTIRDGAIYCVAGFGEGTHWYRNLLADPRVECVLPTSAVSGVAEPVREPEEWVSAYRALIASMGVVGRLTVGDVASLSDSELLERHRGLPVVRIRPTGIASGAFDPGGLGWLPALAVSAWLTARLARLLRTGR
ncbi:MAG TPA: nitroreductase/quinone reductase family protein [Candidatus Limnocylindrales bacterium]